MSNLYNVLFTLCKEHGITGYKMCKDVGIQPSIMTDLKMGRRKGVNAQTADKIASYFGVSVGFLIGTEQKETAPAETDKGISNDDIKAAFFGGADPNLTKEEIDAMWEDAQEYFRFKIAQRRQNKQDGK